MNHHALLALVLGNSYGLPVAGATAYFSDTSFELNTSGQVTGWTDLVSGTTLALSAPAPYAAADTDFGGHASVRLDPAHVVLGGIPMASVTDGFTIFQPVESAQLANSGGASMLWYASDAATKVLDLYTNTYDHRNLNFNTFSSDGVGHDFGAAQLSPRLVASRIDLANEGAPKIYQDGALLTNNVQTPPSTYGAFDPATATLTLGRVGAYDYDFEGKMSCFLYYDRLLTAPEIAQTNTYLQARYGL